MVTYNDDQELVFPPDSAPRAVPIVPGRVQLTIMNNPKAPLEENNQKLLLEFTGGDRLIDRPGLDLVAVLDVSGSMRGPKIEKMKTAMSFVIKKLSLNDRLSIVKFSTKADRESELRQMTQPSQKILEDLVENFEAKGYTNTFDGLQMGLKVLRDRKFSKGRTSAIMLMSDGDQSIEYGDASTVYIGAISVHTFGFGEGMDPKVLSTIARNSTGGTFSDVRNMDNLNQAFSLCLGGLLTVVVQDLTLTVEECIQNASKIDDVSVTGYTPYKDSTPPISMTIPFGDLYCKEVRKVLVDLVLPAAREPMSRDVLQVTYTYKFADQVWDPNPASLTVLREEMEAGEQQGPSEVEAEVARQKHTGNIKEASQLADDKRIIEAQNKLDEACKELEAAKQKLNSNDALVDSLIDELKELKKLMETQDIYNEQGRAFVYALLSSHEKQRPSAKGDDIGKFLLYATPIAVKVFEQAKEFDKDPTKPPISLDEEIAKADDPVAKMTQDLNEQLAIAIASLEKIVKIINKVN